MHWKSRSDFYLKCDVCEKIKNGFGVLVIFTGTSKFIQMKKVYLILLTLGLGFAAAAQELLPRLSPGTKSYLHKIAASPSGNLLPEGVHYKKRNDGKVCVSAIIQINKADAASILGALGKINASVGTKAGIIWTVQVPIGNVVPFTKIPGIRYIQIDEPVVMPQLDSARAKTNVDSAHAGYGLSTGYSGKGVLLGIMDFGFDYTHPTMYDTSGKRYRIVKAWEMNATGTAPTGYSYGHEITDTTVLKARGTDNADQIHGAGVAGLCSGSGYGGPGKMYRGVAYESDMILVGVRRDSIGDEWMTGGFSDFIDGVNYMMDYADAVGKPIVVNISWGSHSGPHDGSSLVNQAFDAMSGNGKIIVMSAGNEGQNKLHLDKTFSPADTALNTFLSFTSTPYKRTWVDIWGDTAETFCVKTSLFSKGIEGSSTGRICIDDNIHIDTLISANGLDTCFVETITTASEYNLKPRVTVNVYNKASDSIGISVYGTKGRVDLWDEYYYYGYKYGFSSSFTSLGAPWATDGNVNTTVSDMGAGHRTLLVGAFNTKNVFYDIAGGKHGPLGYPSVNTLSSFSSKGPYVDGRIKPDITAPGMFILSSMNSWNPAYTATGGAKSNLSHQFNDPKDGRDYYYGFFNGTSAASPMAAGIVALLLQRDPSLSPERVKNILFASARKDAFTGTIPAEGNNNWGHGKINAYQAIRQLLTELSVTTYTGNKKLDCVLFPNPGAGNFTLDYLADHNDNLLVSVSDMSGRVLSSLDWKVSGGQNILPLNLSAYAKGIYFVKVDGKEGSASIKTVLQ